MTEVARRLVTVANAVCKRRQEWGPDTSKIQSLHKEQAIEQTIRILYGSMRDEPEGHSHQASADGRRCQMNSDVANCRTERK